MVCNFGRSISVIFQTRQEFEKQSLPINLVKRSIGGLCLVKVLEGDWGNFSKEVSPKNHTLNIMSP